LLKQVAQAKDRIAVGRHGDGGVLPARLGVHGVVHAEGEVQGRLDQRAALGIEPSDDVAHRSGEAGSPVGDRPIALLTAHVTASSRSIEPIVYTGLGSAAGPAVPPSFNVTLRAESTHYGWAKFCSSGPVAMEVAYSGMTIAMADAEPLLITATASPGWPVLPAFLQERMGSDRCHGGGVQVEVGFAFSHDDDGHATWVRCRTTLDHT
jgi:hypothetical protein